MYNHRYKPLRSTIIFQRYGRPLNPYYARNNSSSRTNTIILFVEELCRVEEGEEYK